MKVRNRQFLKCDGTHMGSEKDNIRQLIGEFQEYDSVLHIVDKCHSEFLKNGLQSNRSETRPIINCLDACNEYVVFGWDNGYLSVIDKKSCKVAGIIKVENVRNILRKTSSAIPISVKVRAENRLVIVCSCYYNMKATYKKPLAFRSQEESLVVFHSLLLSESKKLKLYPISIQNPHHNMLSGNFYVSPSGDAFITGDIRGLIVSFKYVEETASYKSSVLTVVPGSIVDLKLTKGYLLLITCRVLPEARTSPTLGHDVLEVVQNGGLTYYLYNINTRKLIKLELNTLLSSSLGGLNVSCISPVWLHGHDFHFACTLSHTSNSNPDTSSSSSSSSLEPNNLNSLYFCAVFSVNLDETEDSMQINFDSLLSIEKASFIGQLNSLRVLSSQISIDSIYPKDVGDDGDDGDVKWRHFKLCMLSGESGLHSLSSNLLVYWTKPLDSNYSLFTLLQPYHSPMINPTNSSIAFPIKSIELLTYSQQLGQINTVSALWLKPCHNYATRKRAFGGIGLEVWIIRQLPQGYELNSSEVVVLSTRPLRAHLIALAPNITYADFFANSNHQNTSLIQSMLCQGYAANGIKTGTSTISNNNHNNNKISSPGRTPQLLSTTSASSSFFSSPSSSSSSLLSLPAAASSSVSSSSSKALVQSQLLYSDGNNNNNGNINRRNSLMSFSTFSSSSCSSSRKYNAEKFKMSVFIPWPSKLLSDGNKHQLNVFKTSPDIVEGYDIGVDACTLLDDDSEPSSSHTPTVVSAKLTNSGSNSVLLSKSQLQSDVLCTSTGDGCTSERNPQCFELNDDSSLSKTEISRDNSSSTNVMNPSEFSEISKISTVNSCSSSNFEEITTHIEESASNNTHNINGGEFEIPASTNQILTSSPEVQPYQSVNTTTPTITTTNNPVISNILPTDESQMVSYELNQDDNTNNNDNNNSNDANMSSILNTSSAWSIDFCSSSMTTTETSSSPLSTGDTSQTLSHLSLDNLKNDNFDLLPFVDSTGRPGIALHDRVNRKHLKSILAPLQLGNVYSIHISPNGKLIWCLVPPRNTSTNNNQHNNPANNNNISQSCKSFHVDVCLESNGILGLLKAWNSNDIGRWESSVLLEITSIDLCNTYAVFSTSSGHLKIQVGLSSKRPYNQSYTWPCPGYYIVQVTTCSAGLVWCLAIRQSDDDGNDTISFDCDRFVILSSNLPKSLIENQSSKSISTANTTVTEQLKHLTWSTTFKLPSLLIRSLTEQMTSIEALPALNDLAALINCELQIVLIDQKMKSIVKNQEMAGGSRIRHYITAWILSAYYTPEECDMYNIYSVNGYVQCIISSKSDDGEDGDNNNNIEFESISDWNQFTVGEISATTNAANTPNMSRSYFGDFFTKRITSKQKDLITYPVPLIRYTHSIVNNKVSDKDAEDKTARHHRHHHRRIDDIISNHHVICDQPFRITQQRPWNKNTIIMQPIKSTSNLFTYYWKHYHHYVLLDIENINNIFVVQTFVNSDDNNNNSNSSNAFIKCLWIPSNDGSFNKGIKCYAETQVKSVIDLLIPYPNEINDQPEKLTVSAICLLASELSTTDGVTQLFIAFTSGLFMSRIGISDQNPIGTQWVVLSCPDIWKTEEVSASSTTVMSYYFTSICCIKMKLWATDNNGQLFTAKLLMNNIHSSSNNNSDHSYWETLTWTLDPACDIDRNPEGQSIHFKYITGANWESYGLGICLWSIGCKLSYLPKSNDTNNHFQFFNTMKYELQKQMTHTMNSVNTESVYARCFREDSTPDKWYYWLHVPSPTPKSIHINNNGVWLLSSTYPSQIYHRIGLVMNHHGSSSDHHGGNSNNDDNNNNGKGRSLPAPKEHQIGYAWQSIPCPSVFNYPSLNISTIYVPFTTDSIYYQGVNLSMSKSPAKLPTTQASISPSSLSLSTQQSRQSYASVILYCLTSNGLFLSLSFGSILEFTGDFDNTDENNKKEEKKTRLSSQQLALNCNSYDAEPSGLIIIDSNCNSFES